MQKSVNCVTAMNTDNGYFSVAIHPTRINYYYTPFQRRTKTIVNESDFQEPCDPDEGSNDNLHPVRSGKPAQFADNTHHGKISKVAERKVNRAIDYLVYLAQPKKHAYTQKGKSLYFRLNFITLTLSSEQIHSDHDIKLHLLSPFLNSLRQKWQVDNYIWRTEKQANGNVHFHIVTDKYIPWSDLRNVWNRHQQSLGYVTRYRENQELWHRDGFHYREEHPDKWGRERQLKAYHEGLRTDWENPNSTDIHAIQQIRNLKAYFNKYMTKSGQSSDVTGRLWGSSERLSSLTGGYAMDQSSIDDDLRKLIADKSIKSFSGDFFVVIYATIADLERLHCDALLKAFDEFMYHRFHHSRSPLLMAA